VERKIGLHDIGTLAAARKRASQHIPEVTLCMG
jgi:hypothetical protein